ncbi:hypothetical protein CSB07_01350 [Candidatus Gracilibacteria bacterium]|nr:MAG: hypothetical protein CSB07_01350 [Candidatus Gracilibacteria bacterium]PIE85074.1 MAG: hypothetical protein CSA08_03985 [Candidatus Gracilibacteria bacterium]
MDTADLIKGLTESIIYSLLGILIMVLCYNIVDKFTSFSIRKELVEDENIALGIMFAGFFVAIAIIVAAAIK